jgi:type III pantothenate kinase
MMLAIDCGNSRIKWARFAGRKIDLRGAGTVDDATALAALGDALAADAGPVWVANVAGAAIAARLTELAASRLGPAPRFAQVAAEAHGIVCAYRDPATLGVDRWLAMIAARRQVAGAFVVIAAGTAVTFDAVDADGRHLGGLILPGDALMIEALANRTEQIELVPRAGAPVSGLELLGRSTAEAVATGGRLALAAALDRAIAVVAEAWAAPPPVLLTGGDAALVAPWLASDSRLRADLVLEGLAIVGGALE